MNILLASSEVHPFSKTGGLADVVAALGKALAEAGHQVGIITPLYLGLRERLLREKWGLKPLGFPFQIPLGVSHAQGEIWTCAWTPRLTLYFVDQPDFFHRSTLYQLHGQDYPDNAERFIFFSKVVARLASELDPPPDLLHLHDWQVAPAAMLLDQARREEPGRTFPRTCLTLHNLAYQGVFPADRFALLNLRWESFHLDTAEFFGQFNCLKAGLSCADVLTTVSPRYAREITTEEFGCGLHGLLRHRQDRLFGILNGVDCAEWNPAADPWLPRSYTARSLAGKAANKLALQKEMGLPADAAVPLFGNVGRLAEQKGMDILLGTLEELSAQPLQFVLLGTGDPALERALRDLVRRHPDSVSVRIGFDEGLSHRIEAGCDFFVMPSRFEPCGLNQLYSLRYGTVPIVRAVGGLDDSVIDVRDQEGPVGGDLRANGIKFHEYSSAALVKAIRKALALFAQPDVFARFRQNAMAADFSWGSVAARYVQVYERALGRGTALAPDSPPASPL